MTEQLQAYKPKYLSSHERIVIDRVGLCQNSFIMDDRWSDGHRAMVYKAESQRLFDYVGY